MVPHYEQNLLHDYVEKHISVYSLDVEVWLKDFSIVYVYIRF